MSTILLNWMELLLRDLNPLPIELSSFCLKPSYNLFRLAFCPPWAHYAVMVRGIGIEPITFCLLKLTYNYLTGSTFCCYAALPVAYTPSIVMVGAVGIEHHKHVLVMHSCLVAEMIQRLEVRPEGLTV
jgi:hypothetical protein